MANQTIRISLSENMNFWAVYNYYINDVDYAIFTNEYIIDQIENFDKEKITNIFSEFSNSLSKSFKSNKNLFLGNTKFDNLEKAYQDLLGLINSEEISKYSTF